MILAKLALVLQLATPALQQRPLPGKYDIRDTTKTYVILHYDSSVSYDVTRRWLIRKKNSYHYYIRRDGTIIQLLDPKYEGGHAGLSYWDGLFRMNMYSIGICFQRIHPQEYTMAQYRSAAWLIARLESRFPDIRNHPILGHADVAWPRGRKKDPNPNFWWDTLYVKLDSIHIADWRRQLLTLNKR